MMLTTFNSSKSFVYFPNYRCITQNCYVLVKLSSCDFTSLRFLDAEKLYKHHEYEYICSANFHPNPNMNIFVLGEKMFEYIRILQYIQIFEYIGIFQFKRKLNLFNTFKFMKQAPFVYP